MILTKKEIEKAFDDGTLSPHKGSVGAWHKYAENLIIKSSHIYEVFSEGDEADKKALLLAVGERFLFKDGLVTFDLKAPYSFIEAMHMDASSNMCVVRGVVDDVRTVIQRHHEYIYVPDLRPRVEV